MRGLVCSEEYEVSEQGVVVEANRLFKNKRYGQAYSLFKKAAVLYGSDSYDFSAQVCLQRDAGTYRAYGNETSVGSSLNTHFDHIYVVNLESAVENRLKVCQHLNERGVSYDLFEGVNGYKGRANRLWKNYQAKPVGSLKKFDYLNEREIKRRKKFIESAGAIGYICTYLEILRDAKGRGFKKFLILEDDILLCDGFEKRFQSFMSSIGSDWKIVQLGASQYHWDSVEEDEALTSGFYSPRQLHTCGSFAIAFDSSILDELIELESCFEAPFDHAPMWALYEKYLGKCYVAYPNLVMPDVGESTIRGRRCQYTHGLRMKWRVENFPYPQKKVKLGLIIRTKENLKYLSPLGKLKLPFQLSVFCVSSDGLRPVHNIESVPEGDLADCLKELMALELPACDRYAVVMDDYPVSERDLVSFLESQVSGSCDGPESLRAFSPKIKEEKEGWVSVVIPTYSRPANLRNALESVASQSYLNKEIIVVSDNGDDSEYNEQTEAVIQQIQSVFPLVDIRYIRHSVNRNGAAARNTGILASKGEFIAFLDDDDVYLPGRLEKSVNQLKASRADIGGVYCGFLGWNSPSNDPARYVTESLDELILTLDFKKHYLHTNTATYRASAVRHINGFDESYPRHQDLEFNLRFIADFNFGVVKEALVRLNPEPSEISNKLFGLKLLDVKTKFLSEFDDLVSRFNSSEIYHRHWSEARRYIVNEDAFLGELKERLHDGFSQVLVSLKN